jgi:dUTP pyrophosphatase
MKQVFICAEENKPQQMTSGSAGYDLCASEDTLVPARSVVKVPTGISMAMPEGVFCAVLPRSGLAVKHGVFSVTGTVDSDYRGEVKVMLYNSGDKPYSVRHGERIAQLVFHDNSVIRVEYVDSVDVLGTTERGSGGFGSTGVTINV